MSNDPFTLDMFGSSALSSGLGLGVTAFGGFAPEPANDDEPDPTPPAPASALPVSRKPVARKRGGRTNFYLDDGEDRGLAANWEERARMNVAAILTANEIERNSVPVTREHQQRLIRFTGFGASELANRMFRRPGEVEFHEGWNDLGSRLEGAVSEADYASLARCTQYAHFTPEFIIRAIWSGLQRMGWRGGIHRARWLGWDLRQETS